MDSIYCDNHILVADKPFGLVTQPDFHEAMRAWVKEKFAKPGNVFLEPIHRLDRPVGGLVLFARTSKALSRLNVSMREGEIKKVYMGVVEGEVPERGEMIDFLVHGDHKAIVSSRADSKAKRAHLQFERIKTDGSSSLIRIHLHTGRYHQIRAQFGSRGHPIRGDGKYGSRQNSREIALVHKELLIPHPTQKESLDFLSQLDVSL